MRSFTIFICVAVLVVAATAEDKVIPGNDCSQPDGVSRCSMKCVTTSTPRFLSGYCDGAKKCNCRTDKVVAAGDKALKTDGKCSGADTDKGCALKCMMSEEGDFSRGYCKDNSCYCNSD